MTIKGRGLDEMPWRAAGCQPLLYSDAQYSLNFPARVVPIPLFLPIYVIMTSFPQKLTKFLVLFTFTLFMLISLMVRPKFPNLGPQQVGHRQL